MDIKKLCSRYLKDLKEENGFIFGFLEGDDEIIDFMENINNVTSGFIIRSSCKL